MRQMHGIAQGKSDLFFVIGCRPVDEEQPITACPSELEAAKWMPLEEYASIEFMRSRPLYARLIDRWACWMNGRAHPECSLDRCMPPRPCELPVAKPYVLVETRMQVRGVGKGGGSSHARGLVGWGFQPGTPKALFSVNRRHGRDFECFT